jgi:hypothetical protein
MRRRFWLHVRRHVVGYIALMVALGGTSYAAVKLPRSSVGTKQLKSNAVVSGKIKNGQVRAGDIAGGIVPDENAVVHREQSGSVDPLPQAQTEIIGAEDVEPGAYLILGKANAVSFAQPDFTRCQLRVDGNALDQSTTSPVNGVPAGGMTMMAITDQPAAFDVTLTCGHDNAENGPYIEASKLEIVSIDAIGGKTP